MIFFCEQNLKRIKLKTNYSTVCKMRIRQEFPHKTGNDLFAFKKSSARDQTLQSKF